jgi:hypothetical protein
MDWVTRVNRADAQRESSSGSKSIHPPRHIRTIRAGFGVERVEYVSGLEINDEPKAGNDRDVVALGRVLGELQVRCEMD